MSKVRSTGNATTELRLASLLRKARLSGWRRRRPLTGRPDFVWPQAKAAVFVDGCFWHGHGCGKNIDPKTNAGAWRDKLNRNRTRDRNVTRLLRRSGWAVVRIWECELATSPTHCLTRIKKALSQ
jgi:DNA mismatch endonuclease (patch repair protein)